MLSVLDPETVGKLLEASRGTRLYVPLVLAATSGLRRGELLALRWSNIDLETGLIRVVGSLQHIEGELRFVDPKTDPAGGPSPF